MSVLKCVPRYHGGGLIGNKLVLSTARLLSAVALFAILFGAALGITLRVVPTGANHTGDGVIHACVNNSTGTTRIVGTPNQCRSFESLVEWNEEGVPGPPGPDGPVGPQGPPGIGVGNPGFKISTLDSDGSVGVWNSATIGTDGLGLISYYDQTNDDLKVAHCNDVACSTATISTIDQAGDVGGFSSITIGSDGLGLISYLGFDGQSNGLKVAHCDNVACTSATTSTIDPTNDNVGLYTSITIGSDGLGLISYWDLSNINLKVAHCDNVICSSATTSAVDQGGSGGAWTSITIGSDGLGLISYLGKLDLKVAHCDNVICSSATTAAVDKPGAVGFNTSITIGTDGLGLISYYDSSNAAVKVAHCDNVICSTATTSIVDQSGDAGTTTSITIGSDGLGLISYWDVTNEDLKVVHCSNTLCVPFHRVR